jgi:hypothetical protein
MKDCSFMYEEKRRGAREATLKYLQIFRDHVRPSYSSLAKGRKSAESAGNSDGSPSAPFNLGGASCDSAPLSFPRVKARQLNIICDTPAEGNNFAHATSFSRSPAYLRISKTRPTATTVLSDTFAQIWLQEDHQEVPAAVEESLRSSPEEV